MSAPDNSLLKDVHTLVDQVVEALQTKRQASLNHYQLLQCLTLMVSVMMTVEYLPEDFRFEAQDGYVSKSDNTDAQAPT